jgi:hypothetical protein
MAWTLLELVLHLMKSSIEGVLVLYHSQPANLRISVDLAKKSGNRSEQATK